MPLASGVRLGPYEILAPLGSGGMGEVYKARDTRLDRVVAVKVLPEQLATDPQFRQRFEHEARAVAALNHPNICTLHDVGEAPGPEAGGESIRFLVMEYLEGETLADRLKTGALPLEQALQYAMQIADALDKAHRAGIVHRDLKPGNVMLTKGGAKLLDFGLAKGGGVASGTGLSMMPTTPAGLTAQGTILGTFQYMAPEQLEGEQADARTDIFAFGAVLYEMLTGKKAFEGKSHASLISSIMSSRPAALSSLLPVVPPALDRIVQTCLAKDRNDRFQTAHDLLLQLRWTAEADATTALPAASRKRSGERAAWAIAAFALLIAAAAVALLLIRRAPGSQALESSQFLILPPEKGAFSADVTSQAISPDGRQIVFAATSAGGRQKLWVRPIDSLEARPLSGTDEGTSPFWSPDSRSIGFFTNNKLKRVDLAGGAPQTLGDASFSLGGTWNREGVILFAPNIGAPLFRVSATGGEVAQVTEVDPKVRDSVQLAPFFLPDGRHFLFTSSVAGAQSAVMVGSLDSKETKRLLAIDSAAVYSPPGVILFARESTLMAQAFDPARFTTSGDQVRIAEQVGRFFSGVGISVSENGVLLYRPYSTTQSELVWVDRAGRRLSVASPAGQYGNITLSPDDKRIAFDRFGPSGNDVWLLNLQRRTTSRFTFQPPNNNVPVWSPDGHLVAFASSRSGGLDIYQRQSNAAGADEPLVKLNGPPIVFPSDWSADGRYLTYYRTDAKTQTDIWILPLFGDRKPFPLIHSEFSEGQSQFSPDGKWIAFVSDDSGTPQVYVQSFPTLTGKFQISIEGGTQPHWRRDGKELFYLTLNRTLMAVKVKTGAAFEADAPAPLFETGLNVSELRQSYAVSADGQRFLLNTPIAGTSPPLTIVLNWPALLKK